ncbi:MAG: nuclear transport factor 2 family protein [Actinomycetota bacterium]
MSNEQDVLAVNQAFYRAFEKKDIEAMSAVWSKGTATLCIHPGRDAIKGWESIRASWQQIFRVTQYLEIETAIISTEVNGDVSYIILSEKVLQISGGQRIQAQSMATNIFVKMANQWYLVHHHGSPIMR